MPHPPTSSTASIPAPTRHGAARRRTALALLGVLLGGEGCYVYHPVEVPALAAGEQIRVELSDAEYRRVVPSPGMAGPRRLEGRFSGATSDSLIVSVWIGENYAGTPFANAYQDVFLPRADVARVENRQLSKGRTALIAAGAVAIITVLIDSVGLVKVFGNGGGDGPPLPPSPAVVGR